jgi:4-phospho-D-threonate 3-dehydrogenase / 4-phospho-D-erythronate 3-dehydrogenase
MPHWIGISLGDVTGVGPEVTLKALASEAQTDAARYLLIGDAAHTRRLNQHLGLGLPLQDIRTDAKTGSSRPGAPSSNRRGPSSEGNQSSRFLLCNPLPEPLPLELSAGSPEAARAAFAWVKEGAERCLRNELDALVTAPVNKAAIVHAGIPFVGQTELLSQLAATQRIAMMLLGQDDRGRWLRVALATTHLPLKRVSESLTGAKIEQVIELTAQACRDLGLPRQRVAVCGLNPHAGEGGEMGTEEQTMITPAVRAVQARKLEVIGPLSADALFYHAFKGEYDAVVAMYHDQGLAPLKMVAFEQGVNWTLGLPFIRTSPDHGTAYDIAGKGVANPSSMIAAIRLAKQLAVGRTGRALTP